MIFLLIALIMVSCSCQDVHPSRLSVAVDDVYDSDCLYSLDHFLNCPLGSIQTAAFLVSLLRSSGTNATLNVYDSDQFHAIFSEMTSRNGTVDLYPFPLALSDDDPWAYEYTGATEWMPYYMYTNIRSLSTSMRQSPTRFLISPFRWNTWIAFTVSILAVCIFNLVFTDRLNDRSLLGSLNRISWFAVCFLFLVYMSNLKALLAQPKPLDPFVNVRDLTEQIQRGKRRMILEEENTRRWRILVDQNLTKPPEFEALSAVIQARSGSLVIPDNQTDVCEMLNQELDLVFFAYDDLVQTLCGNLCLWQYRVDEYPVIMTAIPIVNMTSLSSKMDVFLLAAYSYKELLLSKLYKPRCGQFDNEVTLIGIESLYGAVILWIVGCGLSLAVLGLEITKFTLSRKRMRKSRDQLSYL